MCYEIAILNDDFFVFSKLTHTRGHNYKLLKGCSRVNTHKYFLLNRVVENWNALPSTLVAASSSNVFKQMLYCVDLAKFCSE